jgi:hypothetical protein
MVEVTVAFFKLSTMTITLQSYFCYASFYAS